MTHFRNTAIACSLAAVISAVGVISPVELATSDEGLLMIAEFEGCVSCTYTDIVGVKTVGIGSTRGLDGKPLRGSEILSTEEIAQLYSRDVKYAENCVKARFNGNEMPQSVFDSTVSLVYNVGCQGASYNRKTNKPTAIARYANSGYWTNVCYRLSDFVYAGGKRVKGLVNRRAIEQRHCIRDLQEVHYESKD